MALDLKINILEVGPSDTEPGSIIFYDVTQVYSTPANEGGWGDPNPETIDITEVELTFTDPDGTSTVITLDPLDTSASNYDPTLPNVLGLGYKVTADRLGLTKITSGLWTISYKVTDPIDGGTEYCRIKYFLAIEDIKCCLDKKILDANATLPMSDNDRKIFDLLQQVCTAKRNSEIGQHTTASEIMEFVKSQRDCSC